MATFDRMTSEDDILQAFKVMLSEAEEACQPRWTKAKRNMMVYMGDHYVKESDGDVTSDDRVPGYKFRISRDVISPVIDTLRPILMRGYPKYFVDADFPYMQATVEAMGREMPIPNVTDGDLAQRFTEMLSHEHQLRNEGIQIAELLVDVLVGGTGYRKVVYDPLKNRVNLPVLDMTNVLPDPYGTALDFSDHKYLICRMDMDVADIERIYSVKERDFIAKEERGADVSKVMGTMNKVTRYFTQPAGVVGKDTQYQRRRYPVYELYYNEATPEVNMLADKPPKSLKHPMGRMLTIVNGEKLVVDRPNPYWHREFPVITYQANPLPHHFFGKTDVDQLVSVQQAVNILYNMVIANAMLSGNNQWMYEEGALFAEDLTNQPGLMVPVQPGALTGNKIERLTPAPIPQDVYMLMREMETHGRADMAGVQDTMLGMAKSGTSGVLANTLQAAAMTRQSFKMLALDESYKRQARLEIYLMQQFYEFQDPRLTKQFGSGEWLLWSEGMRNLLWDVSVESQSDLPHNQVARINYAIQLLQLGVYDIEEFVQFTGLQLRPELRSQIRQNIGFNPNTQGEFGQPPVQSEDMMMEGGLTGVPNLGAGVPEQAMPSI